MKKTLAILVALFLVLSVSTVFAETAPAAFDDFARPVVKEDGNLTIAYIHARPDAESQTRCAHQAKIEAAHRGWTLIEMPIFQDSEFTDKFRNALNQNVDVILLGSIESMESKMDLVAEARSKGIGVYGIDNNMVPGVLVNSTMPNGIAAMELMYTIGEDCGWEANVAILTALTIQVHIERTEPIKGIINCYSGLELLDEVDSTSGGNDPAIYAAEVTKTWLQKYGKELNGVIGSCDYFGLPVTEACAQNPDLVNENFWVAGVDGGVDTWEYIRSGTVFKYSYAQPFELFTHQVFEVIDQLQVKGMNPGDEGCLIARSGAVIYSEGFVVTPDNVPAVGQSIHAVYDYYGMDPDDADAWFNWTEEGGALMITGSEAQ